MQVDLADPAATAGRDVEPLAFVVAQGLPAFQQGFDAERAVGEGGQAPGQRPLVEQPVEDGGGDA